MKVLLQHHWNTGCHYGPDGQPIYAWLVELDVYTEAIYFEDRGRSISGLIPLISARFMVVDERKNSITYSSYAMEEFVMFMYLRNQYLYGLEDRDHKYWSTSKVRMEIGGEA